LSSTYGFCIEVFRDLSRPDHLNTFESNLEFRVGPRIGEDTSFNAEDIFLDNKLVRSLLSQLSFANVTDHVITSGMALNTPVLAVETRKGSVTQWLEHSTAKDGVLGSSPSQFIF
jgi:hypothetical protein